MVKWCQIWSSNHIQVSGRTVKKLICWKEVTDDVTVNTRLPSTDTHSIIHSTICVWHSNAVVYNLFVSKIRGSHSGYVEFSSRVDCGSFIDIPVDSLFLRLRTAARAFPASRSITSLRTWSFSTFVCSATHFVILQLSLSASFLTTNQLLYPHVI